MIAKSYKLKILDIFVVLALLSSSIIPALAANNSAQSTWYISKFEVNTDSASVNQNITFEVRIYEGISSSNNQASTSTSYKYYYILDPGDGYRLKGYQNVNRFYINYSYYKPGYYSPKIYVKYIERNEWKNKSLNKTIIIKNEDSGNNGNNSSQTSSSWDIYKFETMQCTSYTGEPLYFKVVIKENGLSTSSEEDFFILGEQQGNNSSQAGYKYYYILETGDGNKKPGYSNTNTFYVSYIYNKEGSYYPKISIKYIEKKEWKYKLLDKAVSIEKNNKAPFAKIKLSGDNRVGETITFDGSDSYDEDGYILRYEWEFGDGSTSKGKVVEHVYNEPGYYTIYLTVTDNKGKIGVDSISIEIINKGLPTVSADDPSQDDTSGGFVKIYGGAYYAQSFIPSSDKGGMSAVYIYVGKKTRSFDSNENNNVDNNENNINSNSAKYPILNAFFSLGRTSSRDIINLIISRISSISKGNKGNSNNANPSPFNKMGNLILEIRDGLSDTSKTLVQLSITPENISKANEWLCLTFRTTVLFDLSTLGKKEYYIILYHAGGNENNYYKWYYSSGDAYSDGRAYEKLPISSEWQALGYDFAFKIHGVKTGNEPDGIVDKWAIVVGVADPEQRCGKPAPWVDQVAEKMANLLAQKGWNVVKLINYNATYRRLVGEIINIETKEDFDDVFLFFFSGHGARIAVVLGDCYRFSGDDINYYLKNFASSKQVFILDCCSSGAFITNVNQSIAKEGRVILASSLEGEVSYVSSDLQSGVFSYYLLEGLRGRADGTPIPPDYKGNKDGYVSAEEAFYYAKPKTENFLSSRHKSQHPQIYDGIEGEVILVKC